MKLKMAIAVAGVAFAAFALSGPLQHYGVLPKTAVGDASKAMIKTALGMTSTPAFARCGGSEGLALGKNGISVPKGWAKGQSK